MTQWRNRIVGEGEEAPYDLIEKANPNNLRIHPEAQGKALENILDKVGFVDRVIVNKQTGNLIDGHLRVELALQRGETSVPVEYVDLSLEEEKLILATFDPIAGLAEFDPEVLKDLAESVKLDFDFDLGEVFDEGQFQTMLLQAGGETIDDPYAEWRGMPEFENENNMGAMVTIKVHFASQEDIEIFANLIGQNVTDKTQFIWFPPQKSENLMKYQVVDES